MHHTTQPEARKVRKGSGIGFSLCAAPNYLLSRVFQIAYQKLIQKQSVALEEIECRVQMEARVIPEVRNQSFGIMEWVE